MRRFLRAFWCWLVGLMDDVTSGAGDKFATDHDGTRHHPYTKVEWGAPDSFNKVDAAPGKAFPVQGEAAENAAATGNPVLVGGRRDVTPRTLGDGDVGAVALAVDGSAHVLIRDGEGNNRALFINGAGRALVLEQNSGQIASLLGALGGAAFVDGDAEGGLSLSIAALSTTLADGIPPTPVNADDLISRLRTDRHRRLLVGTSHPDPFRANQNYSTAQTEVELVAAPGAGLSLFITDILFSTNTAMSFSLLRAVGGSPTTHIGPHYVAANSSVHLQLGTHVRVGLNENLGFTSSASGNHTITVLGYTSP